MGTFGTYFDSFRVGYIPKEFKRFIDNKDINTNVHRVQWNNSIMCGYSCIGIINFMLNDKRLLDYTNLFSSNKH